MSVVKINRVSPKIFLVIFGCYNLLSFFFQKRGNRQRKIEPSSPTDMIVLLFGHIFARLTSPPCPKPIANTSPSLYFQTLHLI